MASSDSESLTGSVEVNDSDVGTYSSANAPVIGISSYLQTASWGVWDTEAALIPADYVRMVADCGGIPVLLPPVGQRAEVLERIDGLILAGGADVDPAGYGQPAHETTKSQPDRDASEYLLLEAARARGLPVLGICRGMQIINSFAGGSLHQHLPEVVDHSKYQPEPGVYGQVTVTTVPGTEAARVLGPTTTAPCYHHQGIDRLGEGLTATGHNPEGLVETIEPASERDWPGWMLAVQWHPEHNPDEARVVQALVDAARADMTARSTAASRAERTG